MANPRVLTIPDQTTHAWQVSNKGEMLGDLWFTRNIDLESSLGKIRLAERIYNLFGAGDSGAFGGTKYPLAFARSDADGTDRWWAMLAQGNGGSDSAFWNTSGSDPTAGWAQDAIALPPNVAADSMEVFLKNIVPASEFVVPISSTTDATPIQVTVSSSLGNPGFVNGQQVTVAGAADPNANGTWTISVNSTYVITLEGSIGSAIGSATGTVSFITTPERYGNDQMVMSNGAGDLSMLNASGNVQSYSVAGATNASPITITLSVPTGATESGIFSGNQVTITGVGGNTAANGTWTVTRLSAWVFQLNGSTGNGNFTSGGTVATSAWKNAWWTGNLGQPLLNSNFPVVIKFFKAAGLLLVANGNFVHTIDAGLNVAYQRLVFPTGYFVNCIVSAPDYAWFFLSSTENQPALAARWDGGAEKFETPISLYDYTVHCANQIEGIPYCLNGKGQLLKLNGQAFEEIDVLPSFMVKQRWGDGSGIVLDKLCNRNGMIVIDGMINVFLKAVMNNDAANRTTIENFSSGVWCYNPKSGLYCKHTVGNYRSTDGDWGDKTLGAAGAMIETSLDKGRFLLGAEFYTDNESTATTAIFASKTASTALQRGQVVTSQIHIPSLVSMYVHEPITRAVWKYLSYTFERFMEASDYVIIKMRTSRSSTRTYKAFNEIAWTAGNTFHSTGGDAAMAAALVGDEVEVISGPGAGGTFHIQSITTVGGALTITLDETVPSASNGLFSAGYLNNWTKVSSINGSNTAIQEKVVNLIRNSSWIQFKVELRGTAVSPELQDLTIGYEALGR